MSNIILTLPALCFAAIAQAQSIPAERLVDWSQAGYQGTKPEPATVIDFVQAGGVADGTTINDAVFTDLINGISQPTVIYFPPGKYLFQLPMPLKANVILRGAGNDSTELVFDLYHERHAIQVMGSRQGTQAAITTNLAKGDTIVPLADAGMFLAGGYIQLVDNNSAIVYSSWAYGSTGQIVRIKAVRGNELILEEALRRDYILARNPQLLKIVPIENVGIEALKITRMDATTDQTANIFFLYAANCWVKCVESYQCNFAHVDISTSTHIEVTGSYLHHAHSYGGGGKGYGVMLQATSGDCLIKDNIFDNLRHSMILQSGANGNVLAYNFSDHPYWTGTFLPANSAGDLVLHGNYPYANLFEGNTVQHIVIDNSHGKNGPYNTIFRNRANGYGLFMNTGPASDNQNIVGNEITFSGGGLMGLYMLAGTGHFEYANNHKGTLKPSADATLPEVSLFMDTLPSYYTAKHMCPPIGWPNALNGHATETQFRQQQGQLTECMPVVWLPEPTDTTTPEEPIDTFITEPIDTNTVTAFESIVVETASIYPNPTQGVVTVRLAEGVTQAIISLYDITGKLAISQRLAGQQTVLDVSPLQVGVYIYVVSYAEGAQRGQLVVEP